MYFSKLKTFFYFFTFLAFIKLTNVSDHFVYLKSRKREYFNIYQLPTNSIFFIDQLFSLITFKQ